MTHFDITSCSLCSVVTGDSATDRHGLSDVHLSMHQELVSMPGDRTQWWRITNLSGHPSHHVSAFTCDQSQVF